MRYKDHSHLESLTCHVREISMYNGEPMPPDRFADLVLRYEQDENVKFSDGELREALRDGTEQWVDSMQENAQDTVGEKERDQAWADEQIAYYEKYRPSVIRRQQVMTLVTNTPVLKPRDNLRQQWVQNLEDLRQQWLHNQRWLEGAQRDLSDERFMNNRLEEMEGTVQKLLKLLTTQSMTDTELQQRLDAVQQDYIQEKAIEAQLKLPAWARLSLCQHNRGEEKTFWTARASREGSWRGLDSVGLYEIFDAHRPDMLMAPLITYSGFVPSWAPASVNCSAGKADSKQTGEAMVALRQSGNQHYTARELRYWLQLPDVGYVELHLEPACLPLGWDVEARFMRFDRQDGSPQEFSIDPPRAGLPGKLRRNIGTRGSWDYEAYWEDADTFRADWERATRH